ncbi:MAG TPA: hypothetical protein PLC19_05920 [Marmoricola sp.]|nr:hypothetical protein [Marmoricola sp.]
MSWAKTTPGLFAVQVPDAVCSAEISASGGAGDKSVSVNPLTPGGQGATLSFVAPVVSGQYVNGQIGAAALDEVGGFPGGGSGGTGGHRGGGGGGYTEVLAGVDLIAVAGGGGGSGGHFSATYGFGGDAGVPTGTGVFAGQDGADGWDRWGTPPTDGFFAQGGSGGSTTAPGAGGVHLGNPAFSGAAGVGMNGGNGGPDSFVDTGGGGGGGYYGGGGGASTTGNNNTAGGGGGGASFVSPTTTFISGGLAAEEADGSMSLTWRVCDYNLSVAKTASAKSVAPGQTVTYTVVVSNQGPDPMGGGDTVTIRDTNAVGATVTSVSAVDGGFVCNPAVGSQIPASGEVECSRELSGSPSGVRGLNVGEALTITYTDTYDTAGTIQNTAGVVDRNSPDNNSATVAVAVAPQIPLNTGTTPTTPQTRPHNRPNALPNTGKTYDPLAANGSGLMTFGLATLTGVAGLALRRRYRQTP